MVKKSTRQPFWSQHLLAVICYCNRTLWASLMDWYSVSPAPLQRRAVLYIICFANSKPTYHNGAGGGTLVWFAGVCWGWWTLLYLWVLAGNGPNTLHLSPHSQRNETAGSLCHPGVAAGQRRFGVRNSYCYAAPKKRKTLWVCLQADQTSDDGIRLVRA